MSWTLGMMSGTSFDGVDAALLLTDGERVAEFGPVLGVPHAKAVRALVRACLGGRGPVAEAERALTLAHAAAARCLMDEAGAPAAELVGFHGQTILHAPHERRTWQLGDGALLAAELGLPVVYDFRSADVAAGGQGAPFAPLYHAALAARLDEEGPIAVLNLGGVGNLTWIARPREGTGSDLVAFDTGPANAPVDDWVARHAGLDYDAGGALAATGRVDEGRLARLMDSPYFAGPAPKSLDRDAFDLSPAEGLPAADGAATLTAFCAEAVARARAHLPAAPRRWLVTGGGRHNATLMAMLAERLSVPVAPVEAAGWDGDAMEAQAFAFLAVRSLRGLPLSLPSTTGVPAPMTGGRVAHPAAARRA